MTAQTPTRTADLLPAPLENADSAPYWAGARAGQLLLRRCGDCEQVHFMPRHLCPHCWSDRLEWVTSGGTGQVHSYTIIRRAPVATFASRVPYALALVELDEGPSLVTNIVGDDALDVRIGDRVRVTFEARLGGATVPQFERIAV
jgi:hypothetical protein